MDLVKSADVSPQLAAKYEREAGRFWHLFYLRNQDRFFKDRHYFEAEFPQLLAARCVLEVGCGAGNTVFPLLELNPAARVYACDFAESGVALVRAHPAYAPAAAQGRLHAFVADITANDLTANVPAASVDVVTMVFVLSAISPEAMPRALHRVARTLRPGGQILFRDYAAGDLAQERLAAEGRQQRLASNFYVRWDGTRAFYFEEAFLRRLFQAQGFACEYVRIDERVAENRRRGSRMERRFLQAVFTYRGGTGDGTAAAHDGSSSPAAASCEETAGCTLQRERDQRSVLPAAQQRREPGEEGLEGVQLVLGSGPAALHLQLMVRPGQPHAAAFRQRAARALAAAALRCPALLNTADVLELCCWDAPLAALAALRWCRRAVAAGCSDGAVRLLRRNARANAHLVIIERLRLQQLEWQQGQQQAQQDACQHLQQQPQQQEQLAQLLRAFPAGFDAVLAALPPSPCAADVAQLVGLAEATLARRAASCALVCAEDSPGVLQEVKAAAARVQLELGGASPEVAAGIAESGAAHAGLCILCLHRRPPYS